MSRPPRLTTIGLALSAACLLGTAVRQPEATSLQDEVARMKAMTSLKADPVYAGPAAQPRAGGRSGVADKDGLAPAGVNFTDLATREIQIEAPLGPGPAFDTQASVFARSTGEVAVLSLEDFRLRALYSDDGGATFDTEVNVAGAAPGQPVRGYAAALSGDNKLYVAYTQADPAGDTGLAFVRSDDMGRTWTSPFSLVQSGDATHGVGFVDLATGPNGAAAVLYRGDLGNDPYVRATSTSGAAWSTSVRVNSGVPARSGATSGEHVAMDSAGRIYVLFLQDRPATGQTPFAVRSTNGGVTFSPEIDLGGLVTAHTFSEQTDLRVAADGGILAAFWDDGDFGAFSPDHVYVVRSGNQGASWSMATDQILTQSGVSFPVRLATAPGTATAFLFIVTDINRLNVFRSTNNGGSFGGPTQLATAGAGSLLLKRPMTRLPFARTSDGVWAMAWTDERTDTYARLRTDVYLRTSTNEGLTWNPEVRVDSGGAGAEASFVEGIVSPAANQLFVLFRDARPDTGRATSFFANRSTASPLAFGLDYRIDTDEGPASRATLDDAVVASDGASHVYVAFSAFDGPFSSLYVAASADQGRTFGTPVRVSTSAAGSRVEWAPVIKATSDGFVYVTWMSDGPSSQRQIRANRSADFGATWMPADFFLGQFTSVPAGYYIDLERPAIDLAAVPGGRAWIFWSDLNNIWMGRSSDGGQTYAVFEVDQETVVGFNRHPRVCAQGSQVVVVYRAPDEARNFFSVWSFVSNDFGVNWTDRVQLRPEGVGEGVQLADVACDGVNGAVAVWSDLRNESWFQLGTARLTGTTWSADTLAPGAAGVHQVFPDITFVSGTSVLAVAEDLAGGVHVSRSTDGGASFTTFQQLDLAAADPAAFSTRPLVSGDGAGNAWVSWLDASSGNPAMVARHSSDGGAGFGPVRRLDRAEPQGFFASSRMPTLGRQAALPGVGLFVWGAERESYQLNTVFNAWEPGDLDRDGAPAATDCSDSDPDLKAVPAEVASLTVAGLGTGAQVAWDSQTASAGAGTVYDVVTGLLADLRSSGGYGAATCLSAGQSDSTLDDFRPGAGFYYLVRARNGCGLGTYGDSTLSPDPRDALDSSGPCP